MEEFKSDSDVSLQLKKIAEHLVFLEKKLDTLIESKNSSPRPGGFQSSRPYAGNRPGFAPRQQSGAPRHSDNGRTRTSHYEGSGNRDTRRPNRFEGGNSHSGHAGQGSHARPGGHSGRPFQKKFVPRHA